MKEINISRLMDNYTDNEFNIEGEAGADTEKVLKTVMEQVKPAKKTKVKPLFKVMIAAAAAAALAMTGTVVAKAQFPKHTITSATGTVFEYEQHGGAYGYELNVKNEDYSDLLTLEDGRLYFSIENTRTDITDLIDRQTPYIYSYVNEDTGYENYVIAGGTADQYAVVDMVYLEGAGWTGAGEMGGENGAYNGINGRINVTVEELENNGGNLSIVFTRDPGAPYHEHLNAWQEGAPCPTLQPYKEIPEQWRDECEDAWLLEALFRLDILDPELIF